MGSSGYPHLKPLEESDGALRSIGGKAVELLALRRLGVAVPATWVLEVAAFREACEAALPGGHEPRALLKLSDDRARDERAARARALLLEARLPGELEAALGELVERLGARAPWGIAARASATCDDESVAFMAGLSGAVLGVTTAQGLGDAVRRLWAGAFFSRTLRYLQARRARKLGVAVVFQPVVRAEVSGVLSTRAPTSALSTTWRRGERLVNAAPGVGPIVRGGDAAVDVVRITHEGELVAAVVADKRARLVLDAGGARELPVDPSQARELCISAATLRDLAALASRLEQGAHDGSNVADPRAFTYDDARKGDEKRKGDDERGEGASGDATGVARTSREGPAYDLSFALEGGTLWVLQAQRAPSLGYPEGGDASTVWSRATVTESLGGIVSPLTWSLSAPLVEAGIRRVFQRLGAALPRGAPLIASVQGRAYLNLSALVSGAVKLPGVSPATVGQLTGAEGLEELEQRGEGVSRRGFYTRLPVTLAQQLSDQVGLSSEAAELETFAGDARQALDELDLAILPDDSLTRTLRDVRDLLARATATLASSTMAYVTAHLALRAALERNFAGEADRLAQLVTAGTPGAGSAGAAGVAVGLGRVADTARHEAGVVDLLARAEVERVEQLPAGPTRRALERFLGEHGDHAQQAAELMLPRWGERPAPLMRQLAAVARGARGDGDRAIAEVRARADRERARLERKVSLVDRLVLRGLVDRTRGLCEVRERVRGWLLKILAMTRRVALEVDRRIAKVSPGLGPGAVFHCTFDELLVALSTGRPDVEHLVRLRLTERARDEAQPDPPTSFVGAPPPVVLPPPGEALLRGVAASGGEAVGRVRVLRDLERDAALVEPGDVLVVKNADAGLSPLLLVASAIVTQQGGRLTQGSVLARELGVPAVAHVPGATRALRDGDRVRVSGDEGVVERLEPAGPGRASPATRG